MDAESAPDARKTSFPCRQCGAGMRWDPDAYALTCEYCQNRLAVPHDEGTILERPLADAGSAARGYGIEVRVVRCDTCGARVAWDGLEISKNCVYCGQATVLDQGEARNAIRPESLVPLEQGRDDVHAAFTAWVRKLWFRPNALRDTDRFTANGVYVPFWTFDCGVASSWSAEAGHYYYVPVTMRVKTAKGWTTTTRMERRTRWVPAWGTRNDAYDDVLINASEGLPQSLVERLGGFETTKLVPYRAEYLAGWSAEEYSVDLTEGWNRGQAYVLAEQERRCAADVPGDTQRNLRVRNRVSDVRWKHVLLPIWSLQYRFRGKVYTVLVNGQSGRIVGKAPYSAVKIGLAVIGGLVAVAALLLFAGSR